MNRNFSRSRGAGTLARYLQTAGRPCSSKPSAGAPITTSALSRVASCPTSAACHAATQRSTNSSALWLVDAPVNFRMRPDVRCCCSLARARLRALFTLATVESSWLATSAAVKPTTSCRMSTARWRGGNNCAAEQVLVEDERFAFAGPAESLEQLARLGGPLIPGGGPHDGLHEREAVDAVGVASGPVKTEGAAPVVADQGHAV